MEKHPGLTTFELPASAGHSTEKQTAVTVAQPHRESPDRTSADASSPPSIYQALFQQLGDPCIILASGPDRRVRCLAANAAFHRQIVERAIRLRSERAPASECATETAHTQQPDLETAALCDVFGQQILTVIADSVIRPPDVQSLDGPSVTMPVNGQSAWFDIKIAVLTAPASSDMTATVAMTLRDISRMLSRESEFKDMQRNLAREVVALSRLHTMYTSLTGQSNPTDIYGSILDAAMDISFADKGSLQILDEAGRLALVARSHLGPAFVERFQDNAAGFASCEQALASRTRVLVDDIVTSPLFSNRMTLGVLLGEGIVTVNSTPVVRPSGEAIGVINLFYTGLHEPAKQELRLLDLLANTAAALIDHIKTEATRKIDRRERERMAGVHAVDRSRIEFIGVLSHELRNPLAAIMMGQSLLQRVPPGSSQARQAHEILERQIAHLTRLVDDLLETTRLSGNRIELHCQRLELGSLVTRSVEQFLPEFAHKEIQLSTDLPVEGIELFADPVRLRQILGNLLANAVKFTNRNDHVMVSVHCDEAANEAVIRIADTGQGIHSELLKSLFQPFVQAGQSLERRRGGLGLGLPIARGLVHLHGGTLTAFSDGPGLGATFEVRLPLPDVVRAPLPDEVRAPLPDEVRAPLPDEVRAFHPATPAPSMPSSDAIDTTDASQPGETPATPASTAVESSRADDALDILVIEDNIDLAETLCSLLVLLGHRTSVAHDGIEGIQQFFRIRPQVVLCDIGLPGKNGYEVAQTLRSDPYGSGVYMIALSGYAQADDIDRALAAGFNCHLAKPISIDMLRDTLSVRMEQKQERPRQ